MASPTPITSDQIAEHLNEEITWTYHLGAKNARVPMKVSPIEVDGDIVTALVDGTGKTKEFKIDKLENIAIAPVIPGPLRAYMKPGPHPFSVTGNAGAKDHRPNPCLVGIPSKPRCVACQSLLMSDGTCRMPYFQLVVTHGPSSQNLVRLVWQIPLALSGSALSRIQ